MKKHLSMLGVVAGLLLAAPAAYAQAVVWVPIAESQAKAQVGHQGFLTTLKAIGNTIQDAGNDAQAITATVTKVTSEMHDEWYSGLLKVGGIVRDYKRVRSMWDYQQRILTLYSQNITTLRQHPGLTPRQVQAMVKGYTALLTENVNMLDDLSSILTPQMAKLDDADRMKMINKLAVRIEHQYQLVSYFTRRNYAIAQAQEGQNIEQRLLTSLYGPK